MRQYSGDCLLYVSGTTPLLPATGYLPGWLLKGQSGSELTGRISAFHTSRQVLGNWRWTPFVHCPEGFWVAEHTPEHTMSRFRDGRLLLGQEQRPGSEGLQNSIIQTVEVRGVLL